MIDFIGGGVFKQTELGLVFYSKSPHVFYAMSGLLRYLSIVRLRANNTVGSWLWVVFILQYFSGVCWWPFLSPGYKDLLSTLLHAVLPFEIYVLVTAHVLRAVFIGGLAGNIVWSGVYLILSVFFVSTSGYVSVSGEAGAWAYNLFFSIFSAAARRAFSFFSACFPFAESPSMGFFSSLFGGVIVSENLMDLLGITPHVLVAFALIVFLFMHLLSTHENRTSTLGEDNRFVNKSQLRNSAESFDMLLVISLVLYVFFCVIPVLIDLRLGNNATFVGFTTKPPVRIVTDITLSGFYFLARVLPLGTIIVCVAAFLYVVTIFNNWSMLSKSDRVVIVGVVFFGIVYVILCCVVFPLCSRVFMTACLFSEGLYAFFQDSLLPIIQQMSFADNKATKTKVSPRDWIFVQFGRTIASTGGDLALSEFYCAFSRQLIHVRDTLFRNWLINNPNGFFWRCCSLSSRSAWLRPPLTHIRTENKAARLGHDFYVLSGYLRGYPVNDGSFFSCAYSRSNPYQPASLLEARFHEFMCNFYKDFGPRLLSGRPQDAYWVDVERMLITLASSLQQKPIVAQAAFLGRTEDVTELPASSTAEAFNLHFISCL